MRLVASLAVGVGGFNFDGGGMIFAVVWFACDGGDITVGVGCFAFAGGGIIFVVVCLLLVVVASLLLLVV